MSYQNNFFFFQILEENKLDEAAAKDGVNTSETSSSREEKNRISSKDSKKSKEKSKKDKKSKKVLNTEPKRQQVKYDITHGCVIPVLFYHENN